MPKKGDITTRRQFTCKLLITPPAGGAYVNVGDVDGHKITTRREGATVTVAEKGCRREIRSLTSLVAEEYEFTLNENFGVLQELALFGTKGADTTQAAVVAPAGTFSFNGVKQGRSYLIGKSALDIAFVVTGKTEGTDFTIDRGSGELYILPGGTIADGDNIAGTYGCAEVVFENYTSFDRMGQLSGAAELHEFDQHDANGVPARVWTGTFQYWIEGDETHDGKKPATRTLKMLAVTKPILKARQS